MTHAAGATVDGGTAVRRHSINDNQYAEQLRNLSAQIDEIRGYNVSEDVKETLLAQAMAEKIKAFHDMRFHRKEINSQQHNRIGGLIVYLATRDAWEAFGDIAERTLHRLSNPRRDT